MTKPWAAEKVVSPKLARMLIEMQFSQLTPVTITPLGDGWDNTAYTINRDYVFRFPRRHIAVTCLEIEMKLLPEIASSLPIAIPSPVFIGKACPELPWPFAGYKMLPGRTADTANLNERQRINLAPALAGFLKALHHFPVEKARQIGAPTDIIGRLDFAKKIPEMYRNLDELTRTGLVEDPISIQKIIQETAIARKQKKAALVHGDFYTRHILVGGNGELSGIIDWGDIHLGDPALDLSIAFTFLPPEGRQLFQQCYGKIDSEALRLSRFRALHYALILLKYSHSIGDQTLMREGKFALENVRYDSSPLNFAFSWKGVRRMIKIVTILGTVRQGSYTAKALALVQDELRNMKQVELIEIDPAKLKLAFPGEKSAATDSKWLQEMVKNSTGVILATPEYHGSFSSVMKLVIENMGFPSALRTKPVALLGVAAGQIGAIKSLEQLRSVCSHIGAIVLPGPVSIANVKSVLDENGNSLNEKIEKRIRSVAHNLIDYIHNNICPRFALEQIVREM